MNVTRVRNSIARIVVLAACAGTAAFAAPVGAEVTSPVLAINAEAATGPVTTQSFRGSFSVLTGSGGNIGVLHTPEGTLLVDAGIAVSKPRIEAALNAIGDSPLRYLINTHYHWDHTDGNAWVHEKGAVIVAHENTLKRLASGTRVIEWGYFFPELPEGGRPTVLVQNEKTLEFGGETIVLKHYGAGHTDTDLSVYFRNADILQVGDIWWNGHYPFIDYGAGGSIDGVIKWADDCIKASTANTIIVPGHGTISDRAELIAYRDMLITIRNNVARLKKEGRTLAETVAAKPTAAYDAKFGDFLIDPAFFTQLVYMGV